MHGALSAIARAIQEIGTGVTPLKQKVLETAVNLNSITEWVTADEVETAFSMSKSALRAYTYRYKIPTKREYGRTYYSKEHLEELRRTDLMSDDCYYTTVQVQQLYGLTSANICHIVIVHHITKVKVGVKRRMWSEQWQKGQQKDCDFKIISVPLKSGH